MESRAKSRKQAWREANGIAKPSILSSSLFASQLARNKDDNDFVAAILR
jgi:hypothetical protein